MDAKAAAVARLHALGVAEGQRVHSAIEYAHASGSIVPGSPGVVVRPGDAEDRLVVKFESGLLLSCRRGNVRTEAQQAEHVHAERTAAAQRAREEAEAARRAKVPSPPQRCRAPPC